MTNAKRFEVEILRRRNAIRAAISNGRSTKWQLRLWSRFIKFRDGGRCLNCGDADRVQAHHIMRRALVPFAALDLGNGVSLCRSCHHRVHAHFNGRPDPMLPMGADQGDDQNEWSYLYGLIADDAVQRGLPEDEFYFLSDALIRFSLDYQGYEMLLDSLEDGSLTRIRFMHEIWRAMPEPYYVNLAEIVGEMLLSSEPRPD